MKNKEIKKFMKKYVSIKCQSTFIKKKKKTIGYKVNLILKITNDLLKFQTKFLLDVVSG